MVVASFNGRHGSVRVQVVCSGRPAGHRAQQGAQQKGTGHGAMPVETNGKGIGPGGGAYPSENVLTKPDGNRAPPFF